MVYVGTLLDAARRAQSKVAGVTKEKFDADDTLQLALTYLLQNVGEAASEIPESIRMTCPQIDWKAITGMRHRIVHNYLNVDLEKVCQALQEDLPPLIAELENLTPPESPAV